MRKSVGLLVMTACCAAAQEQPAIRVTTSEVLLDLVVRDKKEQFVRNIKAEDLQVLEDGVPQKIKVFRFVDGSQPLAEEANAATVQPPGPASAPAVGPVKPSMDPLREINLVSIVYTMVAPEHRVFARDAARMFLENELRRNTFVGVFSLDYRFNLIQPFTMDKALLRDAIDRVATGAYSKFLKDSVRIERGYMRPLTLTPGTMASGELMDEISLRSLSGNHMDLAYHSSLRILMSLLEMVRAQAEWPGRKTVLFLSEGLGVDRNIIELFRTVLSAANKSGVTFYALDVRGLVTAQSSAESRSNAGKGQVVSNAPTGIDATAGANYAEGAMVGPGGITEIPKGEYMGGMDPTEFMRELAETTGGFLIWSTNKPAPKLRRVMEDVRTHYEVSYVPFSDSLDGKYRTISVRLPQPDLKAQYRRGYYALPLLDGRSLLPYEPATLHALNTQPLPNQFDLHASAIRFRAQQGGVQHVLAFEVPVSGLTIVEDEKLKIRRLRVSFTCLVKDAKGNVAEKISGDVPYAALMDKSNAAALRRGIVTFTASVQLQPGRYTLETAAIDQESMRVSARRSSLFVGPPNGSRISELLLARRIDRLVEANPDNPLEYAAGKVVPDLAGNVRPDSNILLYSVAYPDPQSAEKPQVMFQLSKDGKVVVQGRAEAGAPDDSGAVPVLASFPAAKLGPGEYEARAVFRQGTAAAQEATAFRIVP